jgi:spore coat protein U-like protein
MHNAAQARWGTLVALLGVALGFGAPAAQLEARQAAAKSANLRVSAQVIANCVVSVADVAFGAYDPVAANRSAPLDADGQITLACTKGTLARVLLSFGEHASGSTRRMLGGNSLLTYDLHVQPNRATPWNQPYSFFRTGVSDSPAPFSRPVYGRIPPGQDVPSGAYSDTVLVIVTF